MAEEYLTPLEVAAILKIKKNTVYEMIKRKDLNATKLGKQLRINKADLSAYLAKPQSVVPSVPDTESKISSEFLHRTTEPMFILCGQDIILDRICDFVNQKMNAPLIVRSHMGSYNGLYALYNEQVHMASAHLWDRETDSYNLSYISKILPGFPCAVYHIAKRKQGFYVKKDNPKNITGFPDMNRPDLLFVNREKGCGTRVLLDNKLVDNQIHPSQVRGYETIVTSHLTAATMVAKGEADYALGNERTSIHFSGLSFLPLQIECYDLVIPIRFFNHPISQLVIQALQNRVFQNEIELLGGYEITDMGKRLM